MLLAGLATMLTVIVIKRVELVKAEAFAIPVDEMPEITNMIRGNER